MKQMNGIGRKTITIMVFLCLFLGVSVHAQEQVITGTVFDGADGSQMAF